MTRRELVLELLLQDRIERQRSGLRASIQTTDIKAVWEEARLTLDTVDSLERNYLEWLRCSEVKP